MHNSFMSLSGGHLNGVLVKSPGYIYYRRHCYNPHKLTRDKLLMKQTYTILAFLTSMFKTALNKNIIPHTWKLANIVPIPKPNPRHRQGHLIQAHIPPLSNCKDTGEEPSSLHNSKHTKHAHATRVQNTTFYSDGTTHTK